jgi:hypothetical protein
MIKPKRMLKFLKNKEERLKWETNIKAVRMREALRKRKKLIRGIIAVQNILILKMRNTKVNLKISKVIFVI